jgi:DNA invertase Pin-like site-specific DNA recombinase
VVTVLYARVSRDDLFCENQLITLKNWAAREGIVDYVVLTETMSTRKTRPVKQQMIKDFRAGKFDTVVVARLDRFARSLQELVMDVHEIVNNGGRFVSVLNGFDFSRKTFNASQQLLLNIMASFADFEREIIRERTLEGLARVKSQGKIIGRHPVNCGCGKFGHHGFMKPLRDDNLRVIGWFDERTKNKEDNNI